MSLCRKYATNAGSIWHQIIRNVSIVELKFDLASIEYLSKMKIGLDGMIWFLMHGIDCFTQVSLDKLSLM